MKLDETRIAELLKPFLSNGPPESDALSPDQLRFISMYIDIMLHWNARINLTAVRDPEEIVTRHFGESLFAARLLFPKTSTAFDPAQHGEPRRVMDVGSGPGFPGLPIKIWLPEIHLTLIESNQKKSTFLREVVRTLGLERVDVFAGRAETLPGVKADVVTLRAVERFELILPVAADLVASPGRFLVLVGDAQVKKALELAPGFHWDVPVRVPLSVSRAIIIGNKNHGG